jgi:hypothetical protein
MRRNKIRVRSTKLQKAGFFFMVVSTLLAANVLQNFPPLFTGKFAYVPISIFLIMLFGLPYLYAVGFGLLLQWNWARVVLFRTLPIAIMISVFGVVEGFRKSRAEIWLPMMLMCMFLLLCFVFARSKEGPQRQEAVDN